MGKVISVGADNSNFTQLPKRKAASNPKSSVHIEQKIIASITDASAVELQSSGAEDSVETAVEFSRADFLNALMKVSRPTRSQLGKGKSETSE